MAKAIIVVVGMDQPGIVATVSTILASNQINILDISQSFAHEFFTMIMVVDLTKAKMNLKDLQDQLKKKGDEIGLFITVQHEDVFRAMHRI